MWRGQLVELRSAVRSLPESSTRLRAVRDETPGQEQAQQPQTWGTEQPGRSLHSLMAPGPCLSSPLLSGLLPLNLDRS